MISPLPWVPSRVSRNAVLLGSSPGLSNSGLPNSGQAVIAVDQLRFDQAVLGFDAQLRLFAQLLQRCGRPLYLLTAPEIFGTDESFRHLSQLIGTPMMGREIVHFRFGMIREARILKRATNIMVSAERHVWRSLSEAWHPFAAGNILPAAFRQVLALHPDQPALRTIDGQICSQDWLDLLSLSPRETIARLEVMPLAACAAERSCERVAPSSPHPRIVVPWNLSFAGSVIPQLIVRLATVRSAMQIVLLPFNATDGADAILKALADRLRRQPYTANLLLGRVIGPGARLPFDLAWLEAEDPEYLWTQARLAACGLRTALLASQRKGSACTAHIFTAFADRRHLVASPGRAGDVLGHSGDWSVAATRRLLQRSARSVAATR